MLKTLIKFIHQQFCEHEHKTKVSSVRYENKIYHIYECNDCGKTVACEL